MTFQKPAVNLEYTAHFSEKNVLNIKCVVWFAIRHSKHFSF